MKYWIDKKTGRHGLVEDLLFQDSNPTDGYHGKPTPADVKADAERWTETERFTWDEVIELASDDARETYECPQCEELDDELSAIRVPLLKLDDLSKMFQVWGGQTCTACGLTGIHARDCIGTYV